jgi:hypothetical protein
MPRNRHPGKLVRRRAYKAGDLSQLMRMLWQALVEAEAVLLASEDPELTLKACHAISQCGGQYFRLLEGGEMETRLKAVETALALAAKGNGQVLVPGR